MIYALSVGTYNVSTFIIYALWVGTYHISTFLSFLSFGAWWYLLSNEPGSSVNSRFDYILLVSAYRITTFVSFSFLSFVAC
jgi:hypothetical protein